MPGETPLSRHAPRKERTTAWDSHPSRRPLNASSVPEQTNRESGLKQPDFSGYSRRHATHCCNPLHQRATGLAEFTTAINPPKSHKAELSLRLVDELSE